MEILDRYRGALLGLACGDALGTTLEFARPGSFTPITDMVGGGPFHLRPGQWTDDTSMALCLAESLIESGGFNPMDQMLRYVRWWRQGHWSSTGKCFDIGMTTRTSLDRFLESNNPFSGVTDPATAGNGPLMRLAPVPLYFANDPLEAIYLAGESARTTHAARTCIDACRYFTALLLGVLEGLPKGDVLEPHFSPIPGLWPRKALTPEVDEVALGSFLQKRPPQIVAAGYVVRSLEAALWAFASSDSFEDGALKAVNLGDDADTTGAIYGQIAGAYYGESGIPPKWLEKLHRRDEIAAMAGKLRRE